MTNKASPLKEPKRMKNNHFYLFERNIIEEIAENNKYKLETTLYDALSYNIIRIGLTRLPKSKKKGKIITINKNKFPNFYLSYTDLRSNSYGIMSIREAQRSIARLVESNKINKEVALNSCYRNTYYRITKFGNSILEKDYNEDLVIKKNKLYVGSGKRSYKYNDKFLDFIEYAREVSFSKAVILDALYKYLFSTAGNKTSTYCDNEILVKRINLSDFIGRIPLLTALHFKKDTLYKYISFFEETGSLELLKDQKELDEWFDDLEYNQWFRYIKTELDFNYEICKKYDDFEEHYEQEEEGEFSALY